MIKIKTDCNKCIHAKMCKYKGNADMMYDILNAKEGISEELYVSNVEIDIYCPDFKRVEISVK